MRNNITGGILPDDPLMLMEVAKLRERLDAVIEHKMVVERFVDNPTKFLIIGYSYHSVRSRPCDTPREAIDAAIKAAGEKGE